jgi:hypothetical protein
MYLVHLTISGSQGRIPKLTSCYIITWFIADCTWDDFLFMLGIESLLVKFWIKQDNQSSREVNKLFIVCHHILSILLLIPNRTSVYLTNCVLTRTFYICTPDAIDPLKWSINFIWFLQIITYSCIICTIWNNWIQGSSQPRSKIFASFLLFDLRYFWLYILVRVNLYLLSTSFRKLELLI